ncbi:type II toxin-antitoxin system Phd/YefM family antitoxin [Candidatus Gottesmanbacteria bacterium]|nr:type II toxin-antitoxin system Phd/YefM family antitoxin [Candidatus Gottesmanbacteria bacterium]
MIQQLISDEKFTNIQKAQAGLTKLFEKAKKTSSFYRVMKNGQPLGVLIPNEMWQSIIEDIEALSSPTFRARIAESRKDTKTISLEEVKKQLGL